MSQEEILNQVRQEFDKLRKEKLNLIQVNEELKREIKKYKNSYEDQRT